jgi:hypothetical protein
VRGDASERLVTQASFGVPHAVFRGADLEHDVGAAFEVVR